MGMAFGHMCVVAGLVTARLSPPEEKAPIFSFAGSFSGSLLILHAHSEDK